MRCAPLVLPALALVAGCAEPSEPLAGRRPATVRQAADLAEAELGVPGDLVLAVAWIETQWAPAAGAAAHAHAPRAIGIGGIRPWLQGDPLRAAERALAADRAAIDHDPALGVLATAVVLRELARRRGPVPPADDPGAWIDVLGDLSGVDHDEVRAAYAERVLGVLVRGLQARLPGGEELTLRARAVETPERVAPRREYHHVEYEGAARWVAARDGHWEPGRGGHSVTHIIIHTMQGSYEGAISWFRSPSNPYRTSTQYLIRSSDGEITQMVHEADTAHHIGGWNPWTIGIEHEGFVEDPGRWYTEEMYRSSARLVAYLCDKHGVPIDRDHILGHVEVPGASHTDPGGGWDWPRYMGYVREASGPPRPPFAASFVAMEAPAELVEGERAVVWFELHNDGARTWSLDTTRLGTARPHDHPSRFHQPMNWLSDTRPTPPDHSTYGTGTVGRFTFEIEAPEVTAAEEVTEVFQVVEEGVEWFGPEMELRIRVVPRPGEEPVDAGQPPPPPPPPPPPVDAGTSRPPPSGSGCAAAGAPGGALLFLAAVFLVRRRRPGKTEARSIG